MKKIKTPISFEMIRDLKIYDIIYLSGTIYTARDLAHKRLVEDFNNSPIDLDGAVIYHCGPLVFKDKVYSAGPTTSARMNKYESKLIEKGVEIIIGKGGMDSKVGDALAKFGGIYVTFTGGVGALSSKFIKKIKNAYWKDLGQAEAIWEFEVENFGPLVVTIDSDGNSI